LRNAIAAGVPNLLRAFLPGSLKRNRSVAEGGAAKRWNKGGLLGFFTIVCGGWAIDQFAEQASARRIKATLRFIIGRLMSVL
jgi:hypothetical protein